MRTNDDTVRLDTPSPNRFHSQSLRRGRGSESGQIYLLTTTTRAREARFAEFECARAAASVLIGSAIWRHSVLLAWVLMPDHWHGLLQLADNEELSSAMQRFKGTTSLHCNRRQNRSGSVWQSGYHDHALRRDEDVLDAARYLVMNPVRAGLVKRVRDYPFWNAVWL